MNGENLLEYSVNEIRQLRNEEITERLNQKKNESDKYEGLGNDDNQ